MLSDCPPGQKPVLLEQECGLRRGYSPDRSVLRFFQAGKDPQQSGFTAARGTLQRRNTRFGQFQGEIPEDRLAAVGKPGVFQSDHTVLPPLLFPAARPRSFSSRMDSSTTVKVQANRSGISR